MAVIIDETEFTEAEIQLANALVDQIDIFNRNLVLSYGAESQKKLSEASDKILKQIKTKDFTSINTYFNSLTTSFNSLKTDSPSLSSPIGFIRKNATNSLIVEYNNIRSNIEGIIARLREHQLTIMQDMDNLEKLLKANKRYYKEISLYILAGQKRIKHFEEDVLPDLKSTAPFSTKNAEEYSRTYDALDTFKKRILNLLTSRNVALQSIAQIEMQLKTDSAVLERISTIVNITIPLLKNQISIQDIVNAKNIISGFKKTP